MIRFLKSTAIAPAQPAATEGEAPARKRRRRRRGRPVEGSEAAASQAQGQPSRPAAPKYVPANKSAAAASSGEKPSLLSRIGRKLRLLVPGG